MTKKHNGDTSDRTFVIAIAALAVFSICLLVYLTIIFAVNSSQKVDMQHQKDIILSSQSSSDVASSTDANKKQSKDTRYNWTLENGSGAELHPNVQILTDNETGVQYLVYRRGYSVAITPRLNSDGEVAIVQLDD